MTPEESVVHAFNSNRHEFELFMEGVSGLFRKHPSIASGSFPIVHSVKTRIKSDDHLLEKVRRKSNPERPINAANCFQEITDFAGVRVLHLRQEDFKLIKDVIDTKVSVGDWHLAEQPIAYTWDPECETFFINHGCRCERKESSYTSVHFVVRPRVDSTLSCEIQVRTLFEEIWGEIDHSMNYPAPTTNTACREQLRVLAKVVGAGSRLVTSIYSCKEMSI